MTKLTMQETYMMLRALFVINIALFVLLVLLNFWTFQTPVVGKLESCRDDLRDFPLLARNPLAQLADHDLVKFDAELGIPSVFKGTPRKELDEAWHTLVDQPMILVDQVTLSALDPTEKPTKGEGDRYFATVEVYHQLHCLDMTRKYIWRDFYPDYLAFQDAPDMILEHVDHCIDLLRQVLMCNADIGLIFYTDVGQSQPIARFSTEHSCRNFSAITEWVQEHDSERDVNVD